MSIAAPAAPTTLKLLVSDFVALWDQAREAGARIGLPSLERAVRKGKVGNVPAIDPLWLPWQGELLAMLGLPADSEHAIAPLEWLGSGGKPRAGTWLRAEFVHVEVGMRAARLHPVNLEREAAAQLRASLKEHFAAAGWSLVAPVEEQPGIPPERFHLHTDRELHAACPLPSFAGTDVREQLPQGDDGAELRRLFTEAQMLLHEHPVNMARERERLQPANSIWFSGCGAMHDANISRPRIAPLWSDEPWAWGLARLHGSTCRSLPIDATSWLALADQGVVIVPRLAADAMTALAMLESRWFAPAMAALAAGRIARLEIGIEALSVSVDAAALRRFWRRGPSLAARLT